MTSDLWSYLGLSALLAVFPGADQALVARSAVSGGHAAARWCALGVASGAAVHGGATALGLSSVLLANPQLLGLLRLAGGAYLAVLGVQMLLGASDAAERFQAAHASAASPMRYYVQGLLNNVLNPKAALFYLLVVPQFIRSDQPILPQVLVLAGVRVVMVFGWLNVVIVALVGMLGRARSTIGWIQVVIALTLLGFAAGLVRETLESL